MNAEQFVEEYQRTRNPTTAFFKALGEKDLKQLEDAVAGLQQQYITALQHAATVGLVETVASRSPYAGVAMLESMAGLTESTRKAAYMAVADHADKGSRVNTLLRIYCLQQAGFSPEESGAVQKKTEPYQRAEA